MGTTVNIYWTQEANEYGDVREIYHILARLDSNKTVTSHEPDVTYSLVALLFHVPL